MSLAEYGIVGVLILVIVGVMALLLKFVLDQTREDRASWKAQSAQFAALLESQAKLHRESITELARGMGEIVKRLETIDRNAALTTDRLEALDRHTKQNQEYLAMLRERLDQMLRERNQQG